MNQTYFNPTGYMWVKPRPILEVIKDNHYICQVVSDHLGITEEQLKSKSRNREFVIARQLSMYFIKTMTTMTLKQIGKEFNRDHSTVMHAIRAVNDSLDTDKTFVRLFETIKLELV